MSNAPAIIWFRSDLRLADHPALYAAAQSGRPLVACYILEQVEREWLDPGGASRWWLHYSLSELATALKQRGGRLILRRGAAADVLADLLRETGAEEVLCARSPEPRGSSLEAKLRSNLEKRGAEFHTHPGPLLFDPDTLSTQSGTPFRVFTPFWKACLQSAAPKEPLPPPDRLAFYDGELHSEELDSWKLLPKSPNWAIGLEGTWKPGEAGAHERLDEFLDAGLGAYQEHRDRPDLDATSGLSPHLHFGELSPRQVWHAAQTRMAVEPATRASSEGFLRQLGWREFSYYLLHHWPTLPTTPFREEFAAFPWQENPDLLRAWQHGETGYPMVDAGMRQLWQTGWMHNRVRMLVASFLVKHLMIPWQEGAAWFWDTLVDADLANNSASWQWVAGCGADAAPYFRIFNPMLQGRRFDPHGRYVSRWLPELSPLPPAHIHEPWNAPETVLSEAGIVLGRHYPSPIVDHSRARERALDAYRRFKQS